MKLPYAVLVLLFSANASAAGIEAKSKQFCEKIKTCTLAQMEGQDIPPEMEEMLTPLIDKMCTEMMASVDTSNSDKSLEEEGIACMDSMTALSCDALMSGKAETKECAALEAKSK
jgi:hypothetical protein